MDAFTMSTPGTSAVGLPKVSRTPHRAQERRLAVYYIFVYIFCLQIITTNTRTSTMWKLNVEQGKIVSVPTSTGGTDTKLARDGGLPLDDHNNGGGSLFHPSDDDGDEESTFTIITTTAANYRHNTWNRGSGTTEELLQHLGNDPTASHLAYYSALHNNFDRKNLSGKAKSDNGPYNASPIHPPKAAQSNQAGLDLLTCGEPVNFTHYDDLVGVAQRYEHNPAPEPEVAYLFLKRKAGQSLEHFNIDALERRLRRSKKEQPHTIHLWNQIGNFWRIKGNAGHAIECFRRALSVSPTNADTLLNLARVLFNLQYLDDAISLTKRSLEVHPPERSAWRQYFTLGEIFKAYGQLSDSILHLKQALALHPNYEPIRRLIAEAEKIEFSSNTTRMQFYTGLIIIVLSLIVLAMVTVMLKNRSTGFGYGLYGSDASETGDGNNNNSNQHNGLVPIMNGFSLGSFRPAKHFNRAQAMRSLRSVAFRSFRPFRYRK
ncbi:uncharacterized protein LOC129748991 [Uranotaenia lowii]|uniref:uncharacterized protein LOC129748991 n=1 Tax=Uranotaenia lowii TaxID=190385 RepID=UPI0024786A2B|nr:uncharacterized protein LOC129748991 [Uranotaenia lowii]